MKWSSLSLDERRALIERVKRGVSMATLAGERVALDVSSSSLVPSGAKRLRGRCPFCEADGFSVADRFFHCASCKSTGSVIDFEMRTKGLSFGDAVISLTARVPPS